MWVDIVHLVSHVWLCDRMECNTPGFPVLNLSLRVGLNSCPLSQWCHPPISSSVSPFSFCLQSFPASESFPVSQLFPSGGQVLEFELQHQSFQWWLPLGLTDLISLLSKRLSRCSCIKMPAFAGVVVLEKQLPERVCFFPDGVWAAGENRAWALQGTGRRRLTEMVKELSLNSQGDYSCSWKDVALHLV